MPLEALSENERAFVEANHGAAMITVGADGYPKAVRVGVAVVDDRLQSSGTESRARTERLRADPRCTVFVFDAQYQFVTLESTVRIIDGAEGIDASITLFRAMQNRPTGPITYFGRELEEAELREVMIDEGRIVYEFDVQRAYGMVM